MSDAAQFDLVIVGDEQTMPRCWHESLAKDLSFLGANRNIVEIGLIAAEATGARDGLIERGVNPAV